MSAVRRTPKHDNDGGGGDGDVFFSGLGKLGLSPYT